MSNYIDDGEKFVARLGGTYAPGVKKAAKSLELTDRRMYYSAPAEVGKTTRITSSVIDVSDVSAVTYDCERPRGKFGLGIFLLVMSLVGGIVWGVIGYVKKEGAPITELIIPICIGLGAGVAALVLCYVITWLMRRKRRETIVSVEYRGLILRTAFYGITDDKLEEFRRWTLRVKDKLCGRKAPPLPDSSVKADLFDSPFADAEKEESVKKSDVNAKRKEADSKKAVPPFGDL